MIKYKLLLLAVCSIWNVSMLNAQTQTYPLATGALKSSSAEKSLKVKDLGDGKVLYGYCSPDAEITNKNGFGYGTKYDVKVNTSIRFSEGLSHVLKGRKIYKLRIGASAAIENATVFVRNADGEDLYTATTALKLGWNEIVLDTPLSIPETKELYIGYTFTQKNQVLVVAVEGTNKANGLFISSGDYGMKEYSGVGNLCLLVELEATPEEFKYVGNFIRAYSSLPYKVKGSSVDIKVDIHNEGDEKVSQIVLGRSFNGVALNDTACLFKRSLLANSYGTLTIPVSPVESGTYTFTLKKMGDKEVFSSPVTADVAIYNKEEAFQRTVLIEEFTSQQCGNCPKAQMYLHDLISGNEDRVAMVMHHAGFNPDAYSLKESYDYCYFYNSGSTYAPAMMMDRTYIPDYVSTVTPVYSPGYLKKAKLLEEMELPSVVSVDIKSTFDEATRNLSVTVSGRKITDLIGNHVGLTVFLLESHYTDYQSSAGGNLKYEHNDILRSVFSAAEGDVITFNEDGTYSMVYDYTIPESYKAYSTGTVRAAHPENMNIVAFVANFDTVRPDNCVVLNANKTASLNDEVSTASGIKSVGQKNPFAIYAQSGTIYVDGEYEHFDVYNMQGMLVDGSQLPSGVYIVKVRDCNKKEFIRKIAVQK